MANRRGFLRIEVPSLIVAADHNLRVAAMADIQLLLEAAYGADGGLPLEDDLLPAFFDLRSGIAGELFQKCANCRLRLALVVPDPAAHGGRFTELAREHASHILIRFFTIKSDAVAWLEKA